MCDKNFNQPILAKFSVYKPKPLSSFSFRQLHRSLIEFHDYEIHQTCCYLADVHAVNDPLSFGYCCVDEQFGLQIHILGTCNRDGRLDWWVPVPAEKEFVLSYRDAKDKKISLSDSYPEVIKQCLSRCKLLMEQHEKNPTIMLQALDKFRILEFPLNIQITIPTENETKESVLFRPTEVISHDIIRGFLLDEPQSNPSLHLGNSLDVKLIHNEHGRVVEVIAHFPADWIFAKNGSRIGEAGSEGGIIIEDEEYSNHFHCRITLEDCSHCFAITCGIGGFMVHTAFCGRDNAYTLYDAMKKDLQFICDTCTVDSPEDVGDLLKLIHNFVNRY